MEGFGLSYCLVRRVVVWGRREGKMKVMYGKPELVSSRCKSLKDLVVQALGSTALTESEQNSQAHVFRCFYLIQLCSVYLNVYQLLDLISRNRFARIVNARR